MKLKQVDMAQANALIDGRHYLGPVVYRPTYCIADEALSAVAIYSPPVASSFKGSHKKKVTGTEPAAIQGQVPGAIELARLYKAPGAPFETSQFLAATLRWLRGNSPAAVVLSYTDPAAVNSVTGKPHDGTIYRAVGFVKLGESRPTDKWQVPGASPKIISAPQCYRMMKTKSRTKIQSLHPDWVLIPGVPKTLFAYPLQRRTGKADLVAALAHTRYKQFAACSD